MLVAVPDRPWVAVDTDGVLISRVSGSGIIYLDRPVDGASRFTEMLARRANIAIFSSHCNNHVSRMAKRDTRASLGERERLRVRLGAYLTQHGMYYHSITVGYVPESLTVIGGQFIFCDPIAHKRQAFSDANEKLRKLLRMKGRA